MGHMALVARGPELRCICRSHDAPVARRLQVKFPGARLFWNGSPVVHKSSHRLALWDPSLFLGFPMTPPLFTKVMFYAHRDLCKSQHRGSAHRQPRAGTQALLIKGWVFGPLPGN